MSPICTIALLIYSSLIYATCAKELPPGPILHAFSPAWFQCVTTLQPPYLIAPHLSSFIPLMAILPYSSLCCLLSVSSRCSVFLLLWPSSPLTQEHLINLQLEVSNPEKKSLKPKRYRQPKALDKRQEAENKMVRPHECSLKSNRRISSIKLLTKTTLLLRIL